MRSAASVRPCAPRSGPSTLPGPRRRPRHAREWRRAKAVCAGGERGAGPGKLGSGVCPIPTNSLCQDCPAGNTESGLHGRRCGERQARCRRDRCGPSQRVIFCFGCFMYNVKTRGNVHSTGPRQGQPAPRAAITLPCDCFDRRLRPLREYTRHCCTCRRRPHSPPRTRQHDARTHARSAARARPRFKVGPSDKL